MVITRSTTRSIMQKDIARKSRDKFKNKILKVQIMCFRKIGKRKQKKPGKTRKQ